MKYEFFKNDEKIFLYNSRKDGVKEEENDEEESLNSFSSSQEEECNQKYYIILSGSVEVLILDPQKIEVNSLNSNFETETEHLTKFEIKSRVLEYAQNMVDLENAKIVRRVSLVKKDSLIKNINEIVNNLMGSSSPDSSPKSRKRESFKMISSHGFQVRNKSVKDGYR